MYIEVTKSETGSFSFTISLCSALLKQTSRVHIQVVYLYINCGRRLEKLGFPVTYCFTHMDIFRWRPMTDFKFD